MKQNASHKTTPAMISILLILSLVVSVFWAASMPLMGSGLQPSKAVTLSSMQQHNMVERTIDMTNDCPDSQNSASKHCATCVFISNIVVLANAHFPLVRINQKVAYSSHNGRLTGISKRVDLSPPKIG